jgi:hypothetical protein
LWLQPRLPIHKSESRNKAGLIGCSEASEHSRTGVNSRAFLLVILSMVREPHHDKKFIYKIKIQKSQIKNLFWVSNVPFNAVVFWGG